VSKSCWKDIEQSYINKGIWDGTSPTRLTLRRNTKYFFAAYVLFLVHRFFSPWWRRR
jgi:hypothetical protein